MQMRDPFSLMIRPAQARVTGHMGELVQGRLGPDGPLALVTLPCARVGAVARWQAGATPDHQPALAARMAARLGMGGRLRVRANVPAGCGAGMSSATALAALRAMLPGLTHAQENAHLLAVEGAVDPLVFAAAPPRIWASRAAQTLALLPAFPAMIAVGGFDGPGQATDPADLDFPDMSAAFDMLRQPTRARIGRAATLSAQANQSRNPRAHWQAALVLMAQTGAVGIAVAHTGSALSLLFAPDAPGIAAARDGLAGLGLTHVMIFGFGGARVAHDD